MINDSGKYRNCEEVKMKSNKKVLVLTFITCVIIIIGSACAYAANSSSEQGQDVKTADDVRTIVQDAYPDYSIGEIELERGLTYDVEVTDKDGVSYDIEVDPVTGEILRIDLDDDYIATGKNLEENEGNDEEDD